MNAAAPPDAAAVFSRLRAEAKALGRPLPELVAAAPEFSSWSGEARLQAFAAHFHYPAVDAAGLAALCADFGDPDFVRLPLGEALALRAVLWRCDDGPEPAVFTDPLAAGTQARVEAAAARPLVWSLADPATLAAFLGAYEAEARVLPTLSLAAGEAGDGDEAAGDISLETLGADAAPAVRLVNSTLYDALQAGASDIHLASEAHGLVIHYRLDGVLVRAGEAAGSDAAARVVSRVKVMSGLDIAERRVPQDGRFKARVRGREIDFRVSIMPSVYGEDAVIRVLDKAHLAGSLRELRLDALGFDAATLTTLRQLVAEPHGLCLVTGPTGSGKTTTLYAALAEINDGREKIITIEDPVEYQLAGVLQIPVNERKGLTFARGLRSILRHDPDKIMVGEIRDAETAEIAIQSALTGHLVLSTVHANNVFDVLGRFVHMGIDAYALVSALYGVIAQRLVRLNCPACARPAPPSASLLARSGLSAVDGWDFREGPGCAACRGTGYKGRVAVAETLVIDDTLRDLILRRAPQRELKAAAATRGTRSLRAAALALVATGRTSLAEVNRVTSLREAEG